MSDKTTGFISNIFKRIGEAAALGMRQEIADLRHVIDQQNRKIDENEKDRIRWEILAFANSCRCGHDHTKDEFQHIMALNDKYKKLLKNTNDVNGVFDIQYKYISQLFSEKLLTNDFMDTRREQHE